MEKSIICIDKWVDGEWQNVDPEEEGKGEENWYRVRNKETGRFLITKPYESLPTNWDRLLGESS